MILAALGLSLAFLGFGLWLHRSLRRRIVEITQVVSRLAAGDWDARVSDLVLDMRYNGGGLLSIASELAYMVAGPAATGGKVFEQSRYNDKTKPQPLIVFAHQGIHSDFGRDYEYGAVKELVEQGYSVIGPDYRGSTGWGTGFFNQIDYGGLEVEDVYQARAWMLDNYDFLDPKRVGMMGWSHGGFITLMNILLHPGDYAVAYAGVPVTDLVLRLGYHDASYQAIFSAPGHVGKPVSGDIQEYLKRSPITYADKLETPLLIHGNTNDEDVNVIEIQRFVTALKAAGKKFEYKIYENAPGGHEFGRLDTKLAKESRHDVYKFLAQYLNPERPVK